MARALDRVKAAEAKYEAMAATAEKLGGDPQGAQEHRRPVLCGHA